MEELIIDKFDKNEIDRIANVMQQAFNSVNQDWTERSSKAFVREVFNMSCNLVAKMNGTIVGFIVANKQSDNLFVYAIGVKPNEMRKGVAKKLWERAMQYCKENNLYKVKMISNPKSQAYQWYKKLGFVDTGWVELSLTLSG